MDSHKAEFWEQIFDDITVHRNLVLRSGGDIAWAMRKDSPELKALVDTFLRKNGEGTLLGNMLLKRYLEDNQYVQNNLSTPEMKKFNATAHLFQKYAARYDFDWLMVMSQAYQESRLDHSARSSTGAIGIMQMLPSTAADKNVGIPDITGLEDNIHAGNKYLRFLRDRYFEDEPMSELDKTLFSFAAYNAGPTAADRWRARYKELEPRSWIEHIGYPETKNYVKRVLRALYLYDALQGKKKLYGIYAVDNQMPKPSEKSEA